MYKILLKPSYNVDAIVSFLGEAVVFSTEEPGRAPEIIVNWTKPKDFPFIESLELYESPFINWEEQWQLHGPGYKNGILEVSVNDFTLKLKAGPGFGNLSHPTTCLMLKLMPDYIEHKNVLDVGTGSGILAMAAMALKAKKVLGIDIDEEALIHARDNAFLNDMTIEYCRPERLKSSYKAEVLLINMILEEQKIALKDLKKFEGIAIVSGILEEQKPEYLAFAHQKGWKLIRIERSDDWLGLVFTTHL